MGEYFPRLASRGCWLVAGTVTYMIVGISGYDTGTGPNNLTQLPSHEMGGDVADRIERRLPAAAGWRWHRCGACRLRLPST